MWKLIIIVIALHSGAAIAIHESLFFKEANCISAKEKIQVDGASIKIKKKHSVFTQKSYKIITHCVKGTFNNR